MGTRLSDGWRNFFAGRSAARMGGANKMKRRRSWVEQLERREVFAVEPGFGISANGAIPASPTFEEGQDIVFTEGYYEGTFDPGTVQFFWEINSNGNDTAEGTL